MTKEEFLNLKIGDIVLYREPSTTGWKVFEAIGMVTSELLEELETGEMCFEATVIQTNWADEEAGQESKIWYGDHDKMIKLA